MTTNANVKKPDGGHWYFPDGSPCYELPKADGKGMKVPTLRDARKLGLLPGVTTILKILHKEALVNWLIEQAVLAVLTTPRLAGETDDAFTKRVLSVERVQDQESEIAKDRGTEIHNACDDYFHGGKIPEELQPWVMPALSQLQNYGSFMASEVNIVGHGFGGRTDLILQGSDFVWIWDYKTTKKLPEKGAWDEHRLQLSAYARAWQDFIQRNTGKSVRIRTGNIYISTVEQGRFVIHEHEGESWVETYERGFAPLVGYWQWIQRYTPPPPAMRGAQALAGEPTLTVGK